jgi:hypothetical protein
VPAYGGILRGWIGHCQEDDQGPNDPWPPAVVPGFTEKSAKQPSR